MRQFKPFALKQAKVGMKSFSPFLELDALGSRWWIELFDPLEIRHAEELRSAIFVRIQEFEANYTRFKESSFIGHLNREKELRNFPSELYDMLVYAQYLQRISQGYFNVGVGTVLEQQGYDATYSFAASGNEPLVADHSILLCTPDLIRIAPDTRIDLGGIGKGWLIDALAKMLREWGYTFFAINGGGDIFGTTNHGAGLVYALESPLKKNESLGSITIVNQGIAASAPNKRRWQDQKTQREYHHLINVKGDGDSSRAGTFTLGANARSADAAATILYLVPDDMLFSVAEALEVEFLLVYEDGAAVRSVGYSADLNA
jgi:thiamine biosynthesis lipoprotein